MREVTRQIAGLTNELESLLPRDRYIRDRPTNASGRLQRRRRELALPGRRNRFKIAGHWTRFCDEYRNLNTAHHS